MSGIHSLLPPCGFVTCKDNGVLCVHRVQLLSFLEGPGGRPTWLSPLIPGMVTKASQGPWNELSQQPAKGKGTQNLAFAIGPARKFSTGTEKKSQRRGPSSSLGLREKWIVVLSHVWSKLPTLIKCSEGCFCSCVPKQTHKNGGTFLSTQIINEDQFLLPRWAVS